MDHDFIPGQHVGISIAETHSCIEQIGRKDVREAIEHERGFGFAARLFRARAGAMADQHLPPAVRADAAGEHSDPELGRWKAHIDIADTWSLIREHDPEWIRAVLDGYGTGGSTDATFA